METKSSYSGAAASASGENKEELTTIPQDVCQHRGLLQFFKSKGLLTDTNGSCEETLRRCLGGSFLKRFRVESILGHPGASGYCLKCRHISLESRLTDQFSAIKIVPTRKLSLEDMENLQREIAMLKKIHEEAEVFEGGKGHPRFAQITACFFNQSATAVCIQMPFVEGVELFEKIIKKDMNEDEIKQIASDIIEALLWLQSKGIVHGDLKPENILYTNEGRCKILDFGCACSVQDVVLESQAEQRQEQGAVPKFKLSTPAYTPPEIIVSIAKIESQKKWKLLPSGQEVFTLQSTSYPLVTSVSSRIADDIREAWNSRAAVQTCSIDMLKVDNFAFGKTVMLLFCACREVLSQRVYSVHDAELKAKRQFNVKPEVRDFIDSLCHPDPQQRMSMEDAARHKWVAQNENEVIFSRFPNIQSKSKAPVRGASLGALRRFLRGLEDRNIGLTENLFVGVDFRCSEYDAGSAIFKEYQQRREHAFLLYMYGDHEAAQEVLNEVNGWCAGQLKDKTKTDFKVEQLQTQCLSQLVANVAKWKPEDAGALLTEYQRSLEELRNQDSGQGNMPNVDRCIHTATFKEIEYSLPKKLTADQAKEAIKKLDPIAVSFRALYNSIGYEDKKLCDAIELSGLLVETRLLSLRLGTVQNESKCQKICDEFRSIFSRRQILIGMHSEARVIIQSAKNVGKSYLKLLEIQQTTGASLEKMKSTQQQAIKFLTSARDGQLKYIGEDDYYVEIVKKLRQAAQPLVAADRQAAQPLVAADRRADQEASIFAVATRMEFADIYALPRLQKEIEKTTQLLDYAASSAAKRKRYEDLSRKLAELISEREEIEKAQARSPQILAAVQDADNNSSQDLLRQDKPELHERAAKRQKR